MEKRDHVLIQNITEAVDELQKNHFRPTAEDISKGIVKESRLSYGNYFTQLRPFLKIFKNNIYFIDGEMMKNENANLEAELFEDFLGIEHSLKFRYRLGSKTMITSGF